MIEFTNSVRIGRPTSIVYAFLANPRNLPLWNYYVLEVHAIGRDGFDDGGHFHVLRKSDEQVWRVVARVPDRHVAFATVRGSPRVEMSFTILPDDQGSLVHYHWAVQTDLPKPLEAAAGLKMKKAVGQNLALMAKLMEVGGAALQDGRLVQLPAMIEGGSRSNPGSA